MKTISKSRFISGIQCQKKIWFDYYRKDLRLAADPAQQRVFDIGHAVGHIARQFYPEGKDATPKNFYDLAPSARQTQQWIDDGEHTIYEATFISNNAAAMLDILHRANEKLWAIEVKSSTKVQEYHLQDASLQYFVMNQCGVKPERFILMYINNLFVKNGEITNGFFSTEDITDQVIANQDWVSENLECLLQIVNSNIEPDISIGRHCGSPFACEYMHYCWNHIPENSVFELTNGRNKPWQLYGMDILKLEDIPDDFQLSFNQRLQVNGIKVGTENFEPELIRNYLSNWEFPLHYFDFETIMPAIPLLNGTRPYQQIPFQYSLHIQKINKEVIHKKFLAEPNDFLFENIDSRKKLIEQMKRDFLEKGSIVTYNMPFEKRILKELLRDFPEDAEFLQNLMNRLVDLLPIFRNRWYYKPCMGKSASIKSVLPAILPHLSYSDLEIKEGGTASDSFLQSIWIPEKNTQELRKNLLKYCERDTWAMVQIYHELNKI